MVNHDQQNPDAGELLCLRGLGVGVAPSVRAPRGFELVDIVPSVTDDSAEVNYGQQNADGDELPCLRSLSMGEAPSVRAPREV